MITFFISVLIIVIIVGLGYFVSNDIKNQSRELNQRNRDLEIVLDDLELREKNFQTRYAAGKKEFAEIEIEQSEYYQKAFDLKEEAHRIQTQSLSQVDLLKKQIIKLQTELSNARQKTKRVADKLKKLV